MICQSFLRLTLSRHITDQSISHVSRNLWKELPWTALNEMILCGKLAVDIRVRHFQLLHVGSMLVGITVPIAHLRNLNTSFRIAINDILCDTNSAHRMVKRVYPLLQAAWLANTGSLECLVCRSLYWHLGPGFWEFKKLGGNACTFLYLLFDDKACNTMYFTGLWCFAVQLTLTFPRYLASATIRSPYMLFKMCNVKLSPFLSAADRILWQASSVHTLVRFLLIL